MDDNHFFSIVERLRLLEGEITPTNVKHGLNAQQKSVPQMPALFKPKTQKILGGDPNAKNPMSGYAVGGCEESAELGEDHVQLQPGDRVCVTGPNEYQGEFAEVVELSPSGKFVTVSLESSGDEAHLHLSDVEYTADESQMDDDDDYDDSDDSEFTEDMFEDKHLEEESSEDMLTKVKSSFADYLQSLEDNIKQDKDLLAKKKEDFDLKKKKMKDLELQIKAKKEEMKQEEEIEEYAELEEGDVAHYSVTYYDKNGRADDSSKRFDDRAKAEAHAAKGNAINKVGGEYRVHKVGADIDEGDTYAQGGTNTYAECVMPVVKTVTLEDGSQCTIHGDEGNGFIIRRGERQLPSKFDHLDHATMALDMFRARQAAKNRGDSADYVEEK